MVVMTAMTMMTISVIIMASREGFCSIITLIYDPHTHITVSPIYKLHLVPGLLQQGLGLLHGSSHTRVGKEISIGVIEANGQTPSAVIYL